jgi:hypothetical protein
MFNINDYWTYGCILFGIGMFFFIRDIGHRLVFKDIVILMGTAQMLLAPSYFLIMPGEYIDVITQVHILPEEYFQYAFPATCLLILGLLFPIGKLEYEKINIHSLKKLEGNLRIRKEGYILFMIGLISALSQPLMPTIIQHIFHIMKTFMYVGILYLLFSGLFTIPIFFVLFTSLQGLATGMIGSFLWPTTTFVIYFLVSLKYKFSMLLKSGLVLFGFFSLIMFQNVKGTFRNLTWFEAEYANLETTDKIFTFWGIIS